MSTSPARCSASPPLISTPSCAPLAGRDHDGGRNRQPHRARTRDDEHRDAAAKAGRTASAPPIAEPADERDAADRHDHRHEHRADAVRQVLDRRARALRVAHQPDDVRERAVGADGVARTRNAPVRLIVPPMTRSPVRLAHRHRLAGEHGLVHGARRPSTTSPSTGTRSPGLTSSDVAAARPSSTGTSTLVRSIAPVRGLRLQRHQRPQRGRRVTPRPRLERITGEDERDDDDHGLVVDVGPDACRW